MGVDALNALSDFQKQGFVEIVGVLAREDDDGEFWYKSVSMRARELNLKLFMPKTLKEANFLADIKQLKPDIGFCCFYPKLFPESFFSIPKYGFYNLHFAPLPKYRGALPIPYAIINGEKDHGVTMHKIDKSMDTGEIVSQVIIPIFSDDTGYDLYKRCERAGLILFHEVVQRFVLEKSILPMRKQRGEIISHFRKDLKSLEVEFSWGMAKIYNFVRAFDFPPFELPYIKLREKKYKLTVQPERHGIDQSGLPYLEHNSKKIFMIED